MRDTPTPAFAIACDDVGRRYRSGTEEVVALASASCEVRRGEVVAITGPSGSGKTTLLNLIAGLDRPTSGRLTVMGRVLDGVSEGQLTELRATTIGIVFQDPHLLSGLSALENVIVPALPRQRRSRLEQEAAELLDSVGLADRRSFPPSRLSGGERQRVAIARALLGGRPILLADEPTGNLDARTTDEVMQLINRLRQERELTVVVATHDPAVASHADRIFALRDGQLTERTPGAEGALELRTLEDS